MKRINLVGFKDELEEHRAEFNEAFHRVLNSGRFVLGAEVQNFEKEFARYLNVKYCIGVGNGLEALQISLMSAGIGFGDEVITTPISAFASTLAILAVGAKPVFVDIDKNGLINIDLIPQAITKKTKAILPVHLYGNSMDLIQLQQLCKANNLYLIEDACQAHGSSYKNIKVGTVGDLGSFSFYPTKNLGTFGDGGAIVTNNSQLAKLCYQVRDYGQRGKYIHSVYGLNSRLDELHAALLKVKLSYLERNNTKRRSLAERYINKLKGIVDIVSPSEECMPNYHLFVIKTSRRKALMDYLNSFNIPTAIHYPLIIPDQPFFSPHSVQPNLFEAEKFVKQVLSLPIHPYLSLEQVDFVGKKVVSFFQKSSH
jgi:dTDP-4-amino-4,6-dideoxygalactose transaminase